MPSAAKSSLRGGASCPGSIEKEYTFATDEGTKTLAELFDGRSQLLAYNIMFGPSYTGACPGCSSLADHLDGGLIHLNHRDVTLLCFSRAPLEKLQAYKRRMGWKFPWVSTYGSDFPFDFGFAFTEGFRSALLPPAARPHAEGAGRRVSGDPARRVRPRRRRLMIPLAARSPSMRMET